MIRKVPWVEDAIKEMNMQDEERELVEELTEVVKEYFYDNPYPPSIDGTDANGVTYKMFAERMLSVVKSNLGKICKICPDCSDDPFNETPSTRNCKTCQGTGIVPKGS